MDPILGSAIVSGASNLIGNVFGSKSQSSANKANMQIAQMNNDFNAKEAQKARDFILDMWNKTNEYNSASAQRDRWQQAGFNPYMMNSSGSAGAAQAVSGSAQASAVSNPTAQAYRYDFSGISQAVNSVFQNKLLSEQSRKTGSEADNIGDVMKSLAKMHQGNTNWANADPKNRQFLNDLGIKQLQVGYDKLEEERKNAAFAGQYVQAMTAKTNLDAAAQSIVNRYLDQDQQLSLDLKAAMYEQQVSLRQLTYQQARESLAREIETYAKANGQRISNDIASRTAESYIQANNAVNRYNSNYNNAMSPNAKIHAKYDTYRRGHETNKSYYESDILKKDASWRNPTNFFKVGNSIGNIFK
jgi:hypothetical protein